MAASLIRLSLNITHQWLAGVCLRVVVGRGGGGQWGSLWSQLVWNAQCSCTSSDINMCRSELTKFQTAMSMSQMALCLHLLSSKSQSKSRRLTNHGWELAGILGKEPCQNWNRDEYNNEKHSGPRGLLQAEHSNPVCANQQMQDWPQRFIAEMLAKIYSRSESVGVLANAEV